MSKQVRRHPLMLVRLVGYFAPMITFVLLVLWLRPQNQMGWVAVLFLTALTLVLSLATLAQARNEAHRKKARRRTAETISIMQPRPLTETQFKGPYGEQDMGYWLRLQEPITTP